MRRFTWLAAIVCLFGSAALAPAGFMFTGDPDVPNPAIVVGKGTLVANKPTVMKLDSGYQVTNLTYTVTSTDGKGIQVDWITQRPFDLDAASSIGVRIVGDTKISWTGGSLVFGVVGSIDNNVNGLAEFDDPKQGGQPLQGPQNNRPEKWDKEGFKDFDKGAHQLIMYTSFGWNPAAKGDTLTFEANSTYKVTMTATPLPEPSSTPEPSSLVLLGVGGLTLAVFSRRRRAKSTPARVPIPDQGGLPLVA